MDWAGTYERLRQIQELIDRPYTEDAGYMRRVLVERARTLSAPEKQTRTEADDVLIVRLGEDRYGIPLANITEVIRSAQRAIVPGAPPHVAGLIQVRSDIRPVYRLDVLLGAPPDAKSAAGTILVLRAGSREVAVLAGEMDGVRSVDVGERRPAPAGAAHALWTTEDLITVVDVTSVLRKER